MYFIVKKKIKNKNCNCYSKHSKPMMIYSVIISLILLIKLNLPNGVETISNILINF